ncbi:MULTISPECIES: hypothetical protein [unclassified Pseudomonas]|uniref:hypothetical protein n=1 Tax=unclassified Pseudomonas TaxID=196821 RepID=UPI001E34524A|nr:MULTISPECIES: hypothetical protein [unclassified Pseudomonas]MDH1696927.1 hypothetical protein [Pseudomonas sp. GD03766]UFH27333.1 hypothetical protein LMH93_01545 [Pseudomonas sp. CIP-10]
MDWLQFISSIVASLAWPVAVITIVALLREPLGKVVPMIRSLKYKGLQIDVGRELEAAKVSAEHTDVQVECMEELEPTPVFRQLASIEPRAAVLSAWSPVELALKDLSMKNGIYKLGMPVYTIHDSLHKAGILDDSLFEVISRLMRVRAQAVHIGPVSFDEAISTGELCEWTLAKLKSLGAEV